MILKSLQIYNFGPFGVPTTISFDKNVTVLTGQNDVGKSAILRLLKLMGENSSIQEDDVNVNRIHESTTPWQDDESIFCIATYIITEIRSKFFKPVPPNFRPGWEVDIKFYLAPNKKRLEVVGAKDENGKNVSTQSLTARRFPSVLSLPSPNILNPIIDTLLQSENNLDGDLLTLAFGQNYSAKLPSLGVINLTTEYRRASERLTKLTENIFPSSMKMEFIFNPSLKSENSTNQKIIVSLRDKNGCDTAIHLRGTGIRKVINLVVEILNRAPKNEAFFILLDEPENSLHSNAQHLFRVFLEELAESEKIQVVYATHSASMINVMRPDTLRLFERKNIDGKPSTIINNKPIEDNFYPIRSSLGISPADSLTYAPITIIVEGETEVLCLPLLLKKLYDENIEGFEAVSRLFSFSHILNGHGSSFEHWCRIAKSQGCKPIIFVDGDKFRELQQQKVSEKHPEVPIIVLENLSEFEQLIPENIYIQAVAELANNETISPDAFSQWAQSPTNNMPKQLAFTKKIERWIQEEFPDFNYYKPETMKKAIMLIDNLSELKLEKIKELVNEMKKIMNNIEP